MGLLSELTARTNDDGWASTFEQYLRGSRLTPSASDTFPSTLTQRWGTPTSPNVCGLPRQTAMLGPLAHAAVVNVQGVSIHPGWAKDRLVNALHLAAKPLNEMSAGERRRGRPAAARTRLLELR